MSSYFSEAETKPHRLKGTGGLPAEPSVTRPGFKSDSPVSKPAAAQFP